MKCLKCGNNTKTANTCRVFYDKVVVNPVMVEKCLKCGEEYLDEAEYERIRHKLEKLKISETGLQKIQVLVV